MAGRLIILLGRIGKIVGLPTAPNLARFVISIVPSRLSPKAFTLLTVFETTLYLERSVPFMNVIKKNS